MNEPMRQMTDLEIVERQLTSELEDYLERLEQIRVDTDADYVRVGEFLKVIKGMSKKVEAIFEPERKALYTPYKAMTERMNALFGTIAQIEGAVKRKIGEYVIQRAADNEADAQKQKEILAQALGNPLMYSMPVPTADLPKVKGISFAEVPAYEIVDEDAIPDEYRVIDTKKIGATVRKKGMDAEIPGVRVFLTTQVKVRA